MAMTEVQPALSLNLEVVVGIATTALRALVVVRKEGPRDPLLALHWAGYQGASFPLPFPPPLEEDCGMLGVLETPVMLYATIQELYIMLQSQEVPL